MGDRELARSVTNRVWCVYTPGAAPATGTRRLVGNGPAGIASLVRSGGQWGMGWLW